MNNKSKCFRFFGNTFLFTKEGFYERYFLRKAYQWNFQLKFPWWYYKISGGKRMLTVCRQSKKMIPCFAWSAVLSFIRYLWILLLYRYPFYHEDVFEGMRAGKSVDALLPCNWYIWTGFVKAGMVRRVQQHFQFYLMPNIDDILNNKTARTYKKFGRIQYQK